MDSLMPDSVFENVDEGSETTSGMDENFTGYLPSAYFADNDFQRDGTHQIVEASGVDAWKQWCQKCLVTQKGASPYYPENFGIDLQAAFDKPDRSYTENILSREIKEALEADPYHRLSSVTSVQFAWNRGNALQVSLQLTGIDGSSISVSTTVGRNTYV
ncbi:MULTISPECIES: DUF2634 domain-containing protein [Caproicibacterium]|uniref:DUF2634 domain-containing protein n=1 Tax=Caproicibacterium argilliputei TaxID=3030016 RepID=A0AA97DDD2_9FIRM|nr:DUF2634 domain-containing protein [Caproicibacterium argilliputei]WOC33487.1 DUF2634 domain-containing protein [Caproicibacterium argilliputei]